jgi:uncharacterized glyoxalase superfamily protein PhnB
MSKLFVFGIGGTGSRVLKSLTMLLMAGVKTNVDEIIPIVIDKDNTNGDMVETKRLIETYIYTQKKFAHDSGKFFSTRMSLLGNGNLCLQLKDDAKKFSDYMGMDQLDESNRALVEALFSKQALDMKTTEGFRGIPSIGSVVLNQFEQSDFFTDFANQFKNGDRIFIISSIFGGTGASGFPLLVKTLRNPTKLSNWDYVREAPIGAISVLPYFIVRKAEEPGKVKVDSDTFISKAKAALDYYAQTLDGKINDMYYVGDEKFSIFPYHAGGEKQRNLAHFVELVSALSIIDFANNGKDNNNSRTCYHEFGIITPQNKSDRIIFDDLHVETKKIIANPLIQLYTFRQYMQYVFDKENKYQPWSHNFPNKEKNNFDSIFKQSEAMQHLLECLNGFNTWLTDLADNESHKHSFIPFNLTTDSFAFLYGKDDKCMIKSTKGRYSGWAWFDNELNKACTKKETQVSETMTKEQRFLEIFYRATKNFVDNLIPNSQDNN